MKQSRSFNHVQLLVVSLEFHIGRKHRVGRLAIKDRQILFEYDNAFLTSGLQISPFKLPLQTGVIVGDPNMFQGLMGVFEDSLPDGWGRLLLDRRMARFGILPSELSPLDRLAWVGSSS